MTPKPTLAAGRPEHGPIYEELWHEIDALLTEVPDER
jgi:hypothetical protein